VLKVRRFLRLINADEVLGTHSRISVSAPFLGLNNASDRDGKLTQVNQDQLMKEAGKTAERIAGRLNMKKIVNLQWPF
jgi:hypothetical protein